LQTILSSLPQSGGQADRIIGFRGCNPRFPAETKIHLNTNNAVYLSYIANIQRFFILCVRDRTSFEYPPAAYPVSCRVPDLRCRPARLVRNTST